MQVVDGGHRREGQAGVNHVQSEAYPLTFSPLMIGPVRLRNRVVRTSMGSGIPVNGLVDDDTIAFHVARARGGVALTYVDPATTHWSGPAFVNNTDPRVVDGLQRLTDAVHAEGGAVFQQMLHGGASMMPLDGSAPWAASAIPDPGLSLVPRAMTAWMIDELVASFALAAQRARAGGVDGVEVHGGHGYLFSNFLSPATNHRKDDYGGPLENRMRLLCEVLAAVRATVGPDCPVGVRLSSDGADHHTSPDDIAQVAAALQERGLIDFLNLSLGSHYARDLMMGGVHEPTGYQLSVNGDIARASRIPTIVAGRYADIEHVEQLLATGAADLVSMVRATIADPDLVRKTLEGRAHLVRPCIACNQACVGGVQSRGRLSCTVNPAAGRELTTSDDSLPSPRPRRLLVIGGGPCGLEAARAGAIAGHTVVLLERARELGGQLRHVRRSVHRGHVGRLIDYYEAMLRDLDVDVRMDTVADLSLIRDIAPDAIVVATGSSPRRDGIQVLRPWGPPDGFDPSTALTSWDVLSGTPVGDTVVVLDDTGHYETLDVCQVLVAQGKRVRLISRFSRIGAALEMRWEMIAAAQARILHAGDFEFYARRIVTSVEDGVLTFTSPEATDGRPATIAFDSLVVVSGNLPEAALYEQLRDGQWEVRIAGDAVGPRLLEAATYEGNQAIRSLEPGWVRPSVRLGPSGQAV
jgi:2,4-dienoyl-CoA reductase-like NADH-dependent reductase (Old Yellow Enzyme family)